MTGYYNRLLEAKEKYGDRVVASDGKESLRYSDLLSAACGYRDILAGMGVQPGDKVTLCAFNSCAWLKAFFGVVCYGAVAVLMNYSLPEDEIIMLMQQMDSSVFLFGSFAAKEKDAASPERIVRDASKRADIDSFVFEGRNYSGYIPLDDSKYGDPAFVVFTSGSTGSPKGGMLSQRSNITGADAYVEAIPEMQEESLCMAVPLFHIFGLGIAVTHLLYGGKLILPEKFTGEEINRFLRENQPDALTAVMTVIVRTMEHNDFPEQGYPCIKRIYAGGAPLLPIQLMRVEAGFGNAVLLNSYGQTESDTCIAMTRVNDSVEMRVHTVGKPFPHRDLVIMNSEGAECPRGEAGEITLRDNGFIMKGYYGTARELQAIDAKGYLHTGDIGYLDRDGYLHLSGRIKDIIIKGGENIIPSEVEAEINAIPGVREVKVFGAADELYGENIHACLTLMPGVFLDDNALRTALTGRISRFRMPVNFFIFDSFPLKANGKLDACALIAMMLRRLDAKKIEEDIVNGIKVFSFEAMRRHNIISQTVGITPSLLSSLGFSEAKIRKVELCVEELLAERTDVNYIGSGWLRVECRLFRDFIRISYLDDNPELPFSKFGEDFENDVGARIILSMSDRIGAVSKSNGCYEYNLDFLYDLDFDVAENYLL